MSVKSENRIYTNILHSTQKGKGYVIPPSYAPSYHNDAQKLKTKGKVVFRGGKLFATKPGNQTAK